LGADAILSRGSTDSGLLLREQTERLRGSADDAGGCEADDGPGGHLVEPDGVGGHDEGNVGAGEFLSRVAGASQICVVGFEDTAVHGDGQEAVGRGFDDSARDFE
jgi:hypothetical protein